MHVRDATTEDVDRIRTVAGESLLASYGHAFDEETLANAAEEWYDAEAIASSLTDDDAVFVVVTDEGEPVGFAESYVARGDVILGEIDWLHVLPEYRGEGLGTQLLKHLEGRLVDDGVERVQGRVLAENEAGTTFYEDHGFSLGSERDLELGDETFVERVYVKSIEEDGPAVEARETPAGERVFVAFDEATRGSRSPFVAVYVDEGREERYGWLCTNDDSFDVAMDSMDRIECNACGNRRKAARWDAAYL